MRRSSVQFAVDYRTALTLTGGKISCGVADFEPAVGLSVYHQLRPQPRGLPVFATAHLIPQYETNITVVIFIININD